MLPRTLIIVAIVCFPAAWPSGGEPGRTKPQPTASAREALHPLAGAAGYDLPTRHLVSSAQDEPLLLRWSLSPGDQFQVALTEKTSVLSIYYPLSSRQETEIMLDLDWRVTDADEQTFQLEQTIRRIRLSLTTPTEDGSGRIDLDTQRKESLRGTAGALLQQLNALVGLVVEVKMGSDGSIVGVTLPESSQEQLRKAPSATVLREMFSVDGIERLFAQSSLKLPAESVLPGFTWSIESDLEGWPGKRLSKQLVLKGREPAPQQNVARIDVKSGLIDAEPRSEAAAPNNNSHESRVQHFQGTGWALIDTARGHVLETESTLELTTVGTLRDAQIETRLNKSSRMQFTRGGN